MGSYYPSPGGCDEIIHMFYCEQTIAKEILEKEEKKVHGEGKNERIRLRFIEYDKEYIMKQKDCGLLPLLYAYENRKKDVF